MRKIKLAVVTLICVISIFILTIVLTVVNTNKNIADVKTFEVLNNGSASISMRVSNVSHADGYRIYLKQEDGKYKKYKDVNTTKFEFKSLDQAKKYEFAVKAYNVYHNKTYLSKELKELSTFTYPSAQVIKTVDSPMKGVLDINWSKNDNADGYVCQYSNDKSFGTTEKLVVEDINETNEALSNLTANETYYVRVRSYFNLDGKNIYGPWSKVTSQLIADRTLVDPNKPMIALTFDDGPSYNDSTKIILDTLEKYGARATFFMVGTNVKAKSWSLKKKLELGCEIGNHTYNHEHYGKDVTAKDISSCSKAIYEACGEYPTVFRSPGGNTTGAIREECKKEGMALFYWSLDTQDWAKKNKDADKLYKIVMKYVSDGDIILMHELYPSTAQATKKLVPALKKKGYQIVTVTELVKAKTGKDPVPGTQYVNATEINNNTH